MSCITKKVEAQEAAAMVAHRVDTEDKAAVAHQVDSEATAAVVAQGMEALLDLVATAEVAQDTKEAKMEENMAVVKAAQSTAAKVGALVNQTTADTVLAAETMVATQAKVAVYQVDTSTSSIF